MSRACFSALAAEEVKINSELIIATTDFAARNFVNMVILFILKNPTLWTPHSVSSWEYGAMASPGHLIREYYAETGWTRKAASVITSM
jgi:hypothetical protein